MASSPSEFNLRLWLAENSLSQYITNFEDNGIDHEVLLDGLSDSDLQTIGVAKLGDRKRLLKLISALSEIETTLPPTILGGRSVPHINAKQDSIPTVTPEAQPTSSTPLAIHCPACHGVVSVHASKCPHCGSDIAMHTMAAHSPEAFTAGVGLGIWGALTCTVAHWPFISDGFSVMNEDECGCTIIFILPMIMFLYAIYLLPSFWIGYGLKKHNKSLFLGMLLIAALGAMFGYYSAPEESSGSNSSYNQPANSNSYVSRECSAENRMGYPMKCVPCCNELYGGSNQCYLHCGRAGN